jgi:hypothetical protein
MPRKDQRYGRFYGAPKIEPLGAIRCGGPGSTRGPCLALDGDVNTIRPIAVRNVKAAGRTISVELFRNECGTVAARCLLGSGDMPIIDGPTAEEVMAAVEDSMEGLLFARERTAA